MSKEGEFSNFKDESEDDFKFDWAVGREFEHWITVAGGKLRIRTEVTYFKLPTEEGQENKPNEDNQI